MCLACLLCAGILLAWLPGTSDVHAQERSPDALHGASPDTLSALPARSDTLQVVGGGPFLLRPFLVTEGFHVRVNDAPVPETGYDLDQRNGLIHFRGVAPDSVLQVIATYRYIPLEMASSYRLWDARETTDSGDAAAETPRSTATPSSLRTRGQVTRGVLTGNNQSARIESGLRLQVEGEVAPGVQLEAELTDEDTPLVPEGVTRQFDQFDRIRIGFRSSYGRIDLGDFDALLQGTRYGRLQRKLQGAGVSTSSIVRPAPGLTLLRVSAGAAISRGQFHAIDLDIKEGVQGPYRLLGAAGERFILVLPGTERVYLDGVLMERGADGDYVMDYALGELTFTARHLMGPDRRVRLEYEYTTNRYTRTLSFTEAEIGIGTKPDKPWARLIVGGIREADGSAFVDEQGLTAQDSATVAQSTDGSVRIDGATRVVYDPEALFTHYTRSEQADGSLVYTEYVGAASETVEVYRVPFTFVGEDQGDYRRVPSQSGGIAYEWVGPANGSYIAARTLPVPSRKMLGEVRLHLLGIPGFTLEAGVAGSSRDRNRLSPDEASVVSDASWDVALRSSPLRMGSQWTGQATGFYSSRGAFFETFERIRSVEFAREWGLPLTVSDPFGALISGSDESVAEISVSINSDDSSRIDLFAGRLQVGELITAFRGGGDLRFDARKQVTITGGFEHSSAERIQGEVFSTKRSHARLRLERSLLSQGWRPWTELESDRWDTEGNGYGDMTLAEQTRRLPFTALRLGTTRGWVRHQLQLSSSLREEQTLTLGDLVLGGSRIVTGQGGWTFEPSSRMRSSATIGIRQTSRREEDTGADTAQNPSAERALLIGWDGQVRSADAGTVTWRYDVRSEQTAWMQEVYIRTGPERGSYVWLDTNGDGRIQLDEYFPETTPGEGEYARTLFPSDSLESVTTAEARLTYSFLPTTDTPLWRKVRWQTNIDLRETSRATDRTSVYLLRPSALRQAGETINGRIRVSQRVGLFPLRRDRELELRVMRAASLAELASGSERAKRFESGVSALEAIREDMDLTFDGSWATEEAGSERFASRQFNIERWEARPGAVIRRGDVRVQSELMMGSASEAVTDATVRTLRVPLDLFWTRSSASWRAGGEWSDSRISGGTPVGLQLYELTQGRGAGQSWMWHLHIDIRLTEVMTATLRYDGRRPSTTDTIHTGRFHLTARF